MEQQERSKMLGTMPMGRLVPKVSVPIMVSMLVQALYNIVDGIFVARYSPNALTAVSLAFPIQLLMIAVATGLGVGINSLISRKLGQKRTEEAREAARCGMLLELCGFVVFLLFGLLGSHSFFHVFTPDPELQQMAGDYLRIVTVFSFGLFLSISFERMMQATGNTMLSMTTQLTGAVINIILDPIMIFGLLGTPQMGVAGAAAATVIGQIGGMLLGVYFKLQSFVFMPVFGLSNGLVAIVGYNYGARLRQRVYDAIRVAVKLAVVIMAVGTAAFLLIPELLLSLFEAEGASDLTAMGVVALRIISSHFILAAIGITLSTVFQAIGKGFYSLLMSLCRQLIVLLPAAWILSRLGGLNAVWWCFPVAEAVSLTLCLALFRKVDVRMLKPLGQEA